MDKFERQFEHLDVQTQTMEEAMSGVTTLTVPEVRQIGHSTCDSSGVREKQNLLMWQHSLVVQKFTVF